MKKILLINPKNVAYTLAEGKVIPLGLAYIAAVLRNAGHAVTVIDLQVARGETIERAMEACDIVGIAVLSPNAQESLRLARIAKEKNKFVMVGGPHPSVLPEESLASGYVDVVCRKESEFSALEVANGVPFESIKGISFMRDGKMVHTPDREYIRNLDEIPFPARDLFPNDKYKLFLHKGKQVMTMLASRGCPHECNFCYKGVSGRIYRMRSVENMLAEWEEMIRMGADEIVIVDDSFTVKKANVLAFCETLVKNKMNIHWEGSSRVDCVDKEMLLKMKQAGYWRIAFGIESSSQKILDTIGKGITKDTIRNAVTWAKQAGLEVTGFFVLGNYGENAATMNETIEFAKELPLDYVQFTIATPYPGTQLYDIVKKEGKFLFTDWSELGSYSGKAYFEVGELTKELVESTYKRAYRSVYLRPGMILKKLMHFNPQMLKFLKLLR